MDMKQVWLPLNEPHKRSVLRDTISVFIVQNLNF